MFFRKKTELDEPIAAVLNEMAEYGPGNPDEYGQQLIHLERLVRLRQERHGRVSPDTMAIVAGNLLGILIIVVYEQKHVMGTKALNFIMRPKH